MSHPCIAEIQDKDWLPKADWLQCHQDLLKRRDSLRDTQVVFFGDSITQGWGGDGKAAWDKYFGQFRPLNTGIGGDETSHLLWRIENGALDGISPKALVLLIGTNNLGNAGHTGKDTAEGVKLVVQKVRQKLPATKVLLLGVFPRDAEPNTHFRKEIAIVNGIISKLHDGSTIHYVDYSPVFLRDGGKLPQELSPDYLHLSPAAYELWARAMTPHIQALL